MMRRKKSTTGDIITPYVIQDDYNSLTCMEKALAFTLTTEPVKELLKRYRRRERKLVSPMTNPIKLLSSKPPYEKIIAVN